MIEELKRKIEDIKSLCVDRLDAKTADGHILNTVFKEIEELLEKESSKSKK